MADITTEEVIKIVLAVLGITILLLLGYSLYKIFSQQTELEQAKSSLEQITSIIKDLENGQSAEYLLTGPKKWYFTEYHSKQSYTNSKGEKVNLVASPYCKSGDCLCFCFGDSLDITRPTYLLYFYDFDYATYLKNYFYSEENVNTGEVTENPGFLKCEKKNVCYDINGVTISYEDAFNFKIPLGRTTKSNLVKFNAPFVLLNQTKEIRIEKLSSGEVVISSKPSKPNVY